MTVNLNNEQNLELLLENLIRVQAKLIEKVDSLNKRLIQIEQTHHMTSHQDILSINKRLS
ncbi:hypothetical protein HNR53_003890 [Bacillus benzoevorans]|uniref:Uncharacterized protein n=1 Tax=Bacillus benzoevorans TaxID=1456 RepID=A0A7X0HUU7_9BACI|nr:hypothetical protein [Bacillus benzoevorans]